MKSLRVPADKKVSKVHVVSKAYYRHKENVPSDRIIVIFKSGETELFDYELDSDVILAEGEDPNGTHAHIYLVENEKQKEHDQKVTGVDSSKYVKLIVTSDTSGSIKMWSLEKRFMREIQFPHPIDSVCFLNKSGDILVSHVQRISKIRFATYWTSSFTHFGFTETTDDIHLKYKENGATIESEMYDDHVYIKPPPTRLRIINDEHFSALFRTKTEEEMMHSGGNVSKIENTSNTAQSTVNKLGTAMLKTMNVSATRKTSGLAVGGTGPEMNAVQSAMDMSAKQSRLGDGTSSMRKVQD